MDGLGAIFVLALFAMFTPTLLAAATVMMLLPNPRRLMLGYLLGAYTTAIGGGLIVVFALHDTSSTETSKQTLGPIEDIVLGLLGLLIAYVLASGRDERLRERRKRKREGKEAEEGSKEPWTDRMLGRGSARVTFAVGAVLSLPGVSYLTALDKMAKLDAGVPETVALVIAFVLIEMLLLEVPLVGYAFAPERTEEAVGNFRAGLSVHGRRIGTIVAAVLGALLILRGVIEFLVQ